MPTAAPTARWTTTHVYGFEKYAVTPQHPRRRTIHPRVRVGAVTLSMLLAGVMSALAILSLLLSNSGATKGYELRAIQAQHEELVNDTKVLRMRVAELQALRNLDTVTGMVVPQDVARVTVEQRVATSD